MSKDLNFPVKGDNFGGLDRFWFVAVEDVDSIDVNGHVILRDGVVWNIGRATRHTLDYNCPDRMTKGGTIYGPSLVGISSKWTPELEAVLSEMRGNRYVLIVKDRNGYLTQVGTKGQGLLFESRRGSGTTPDSKNGVDFSFRGSVTEEPIYFNLEIVTSDEQNDVVIADVPPSIVKINGNIVAILAPGETYEISSEFTLEYELQNVG